MAAIGTNLAAVVAEEAAGRSYRFDRTRILEPPPPGAALPRIPVTEGQIKHEWAHLLAKLRLGSPDRAARLAGIAGLTRPEVHPLFTLVPGPVETWERL